VNVPRNHLPRRLAILVCVALVGSSSMLLEGCSGGNAESSALAEITPARTQPIELRDIAYSVATVEVSVGEVVDLDLRNAGSLPHDFTVDEVPVERLVIGKNAGAHAGHGSKYDLHAGPEIGEAVTLRFRPTKAGSYTFYCSTEGHRAAGMTGTLVVQ
jgi:uncharacterized cupredoxin-like copper-binding protein